MKVLHLLLCSNVVLSLVIYISKTIPSIPALTSRIILCIMNILSSHIVRTIVIIHILLLLFLTA